MYVEDIKKFKGIKDSFFIFDKDLFDKIEFSFSIAENDGDILFVVILKDSHLQMSKNRNSLNDNYVIAKIRVPDEMAGKLIKDAEKIGKFNVCAMSKLINASKNTIDTLYYDIEYKFKKIKQVKDSAEVRSERLFSMLNESTKLELELFGGLDNVQENT